MVRIMTWNVWSGKNWKQIVEFIKQHRIEIMGLQEVDCNLERTGYVDLGRKIADTLGFHYAYGASIEEGEGKFGNCVISKYPILEHQRHFLSSTQEWDKELDGQTQPRTLLETKIKIGSEVIWFLTTHLAYEREFKTTHIRKKQISKVTKVLEKNNESPLILLGDFNSLPGNEEIAEIRKYLKDITADQDFKTWTMHDFDYQGWKVAKGLKYKIDYIFVSPNMGCHNVRIVETGISDHVPIICDINLPK